ncbi:MAG: hypothetical protein Kow0029_21020 [Candidatus Rifleibacteriota bacterium]
MNSILMVVIAIVILLLVFVMFSLDDHEDETDFLEDQPESANGAIADEKSSKSDEPEEAPEKSKESAEAAAIRPIKSEGNNAGAVTLELGTEDDLRFRMMFDQQIPLPTGSEEFSAVAAAVQLRFPEETISAGESFIKLISRAESLFEKEFSFPFSCYASGQLDRIWLFDKNNTRDDELFEALVVSYEAVSRFKKAIETDSVLREAKVRIAIGLSMGKILKVKRGVAAEPSLLGKAVYLAETLAEAAGDFSIYVDSQIHKAALPLFDFREWKPIKMRSPLPALPLFELVGWNKPEEVAGFASHEDAYSRKAVAIAYRYLDLDNMLQPLLELLTDSDEKVALEALETLRVIGSDQALGLLKRIFPEAQDPTFRSAIINAFASIGKSEVVPVIIGSTKEGSWKVRFSAAKALYKLSGKDALRHLEHLLDDSDGAVRACVNSIFFKETQKSEYLEELAELLHDLSIRARKAAFDELLDMDTEANLKIVVDNFAEQDFELQKHILNRLERSKSKILYQCFLTMFKNSGEKIRPHIVEAVRRAGLVS